MGKAEDVEQKTAEEERAPRVRSKTLRIVTVSRPRTTTLEMAARPARPSPAATTLEMPASPPPSR